MKRRLSENYDSLFYGVWKIIGIFASQINMKSIQIKPINQ